MDASQNSSGPDLTLAPQDPLRPGKIPGVDLMRFVAAIWVACWNGASLPLGEVLPKHGLASTLLVGLSNSLFNGFDALVVFFLLSGLCIHYQNKNRTTVPYLSFVARRAVRIGIPLCTIVAIALALGEKYFGTLSVILWTLLCEAAYYLLYPLLFQLAKRVPWSRLLFVSSALSGGLAVLYWNKLYFWDLGLFTWIFCLPFFLAGVLLAEQLPFKAPRIRSLWLWRVGALVHGLLAIQLLFHSPIRIGVIWTVGPFAIYIYFWLKQELGHWALSRLQWLERLGLASYSIYLTHKLALMFAKDHLLYMYVPSRWALSVILAIVSAAVFYLLIEQPSHWLSRSMHSKPTPEGSHRFAP